MEIDDVKIRRIVERYRAEKDDDRSAVIEEFRREIEVYIYNFPRLAFRKGPDCCADFYLYAVDRIESIVRNFPEDGGVKFKTWLNYVLRNQFVNYYRSVRREDSVVLPPEEFEERILAEFPAGEPEDHEGLREGLACLPQADRDLIELYYLPERMQAAQVRRLSEISGMGIGEVLNVRRDIMAAHERETAKLRRTAADLGGIDKKLTGLKHRLYLGKDLLPGEQNELLARVARMESRKLRLVRELQAPDHEAFQYFALLFRNAGKARYRLNSAKQKLKFEILKFMRSRKTS